MNHPIKFRVWHKELNKFLPNEEWVIGLKGDLYFYGIRGNQTDLFVVDKKLYTIQQFTGLLDKNGKEIYEGDIISIYTWQSRKENLEIKWQSWGAFNLAGFTEYGEAEIVGNIFQNPELIK